MKKHKENEKNSAASKEEQLKKRGRREFLGRSGLTAGAALTAFAAGGVAKGAHIQTDQSRLMAPDLFRQMLNQALTDRAFQNDIQKQGFKALDARGYQHGVPLDVQATLESALFTSVEVAAKPRCGICGICGLCGLCGEVNAGSASAALWALFYIAA